MFWYESWCIYVLVWWCIYMYIPMNTCRTIIYLIMNVDIISNVNTICVNMSILFPMSILYYAISLRVFLSTLHTTPVCKSAGSTALRVLARVLPRVLSRPPNNCPALPMKFLLRRFVWNKNFCKKNLHRRIRWLVMLVATCAAAARTWLRVKTWFLYYDCVNMISTLRFCKYYDCVNMWKYDFYIAIV